MVNEKTAGRELTGTVVCSSMDQTISVLVTRRVKHKLYNKYMKRSKKFLVHDPENTAKDGDTVRICEHRPISKRKTWILVEVIKKIA